MCIRDRHEIIEYQKTAFSGECKGASVNHLEHVIENKRIESGLFGDIPDSLEARNEEGAYVERSLFDLDDCVEWRAGEITGLSKGEDITLRGYHVFDNEFRGQILPEGMKVLKSFDLTLTHFLPKRVEPVQRSVSVTAPITSERVENAVLELGEKMSAAIAEVRTHP